MRLLAFELKKVLFSKKFLILLLILLVGIILLFLRNMLFESYVEEEERQHIESLIQPVQSNFRMNQNTLSQDPDNEEIKRLQEINGSLLDSLYELRLIATTDQWQDKLSLENQILNFITAYKDEGGDYPLSYKEISNRFALNEKLLEEEIMPEHETFSKAFPNFMKMVVDIFINIGAILVIVILVGEIMSSEFENRSINLLFTQPLKRSNIVTSKFCSSIITYFVTTGIILVSVIAVGSIFGENGTFEYPILMENNNEIEFITISEYIIQSLIVISITMIMVIALYLVYSLLFKQTLLTLFALLGTLLIGYGLKVFISWVPFAWINPFQYIMPEDVLLFQNGRVWYQGIPIILITTITLFLVAKRKIKLIKVD